MSPQHRPTSIRLRRAIAHLGLLALVCLSGPAQGQGPASGTIEGRVYNPATGAFLEGARLRVEGTSIETFTDADGNYRLQQVPAGAVAVTAFFTGTGLQRETVSVIAGGTIQRDFQLSPSAGKRVAGADDEPIKLDNYVIAASRVMSGAALAINEQRFAPNMKNVVSADEFGDVPEGNVAEFLKFMPGVSVDVTGGHARGVSVNGVPADYVPVSIDGFSVASAVGSGGGGGTGRLVAMDMVAINNMSRIEVSFSPTPESEGSALAGSINLVPRSSFERSRPLFKSSVFLMLRDNAMFLHKTPGPREPTRKVHPGFDFSYVAPVSKRFGFALSGSRSRQSTSAPQSLTTWRGVSVATNGVAFPHTAFDQPYLTTYSVRTGANQHTRSALGATVDLRLGARDRISFSFQYSDLEVVVHHNALAFNVNRVLPGQFTTTMTRGAPAAGSAVLSTSNNSRWDWTYMPSLLWRHDGAVWKAEAGAALARAHHWRDEPREGLFGSTTAQRTGLTVSFDDIFYLRPGVITVTDGTSGAPVDPFSLTNYAVTGATTGSDWTDDTRRSAYARVSRDFFGRIPFTAKAGLDFRQAVRDTGGRSSSLTLAGPNNQALQFLDASFSTAEASFGFPRIQAVSSEKLYAHYVANPALFTANANNEYRSAISSSKNARELVSSAYLRGDVTLFRHRLKLIGGVRAEQTNISAQGPLDDRMRNFQRRADGSLLLGADGRPVPIASAALDVSRLTFIARGAKAEKEYLRLFPSLNASFNVRENLVARAAIYTSVGRPNFNQYAGGITLPDTEAPPASNNRITVNNVAIKAWSATTVNARLEYYFAGVGQISVGAFRRQIGNFFGSTEFEATPEFLALYGLDPVLYDGYNVATQHNLQSKVRLDGGDFNYKQALTFLPHWARGVQVFATASIQRTLGDESANFAGFTPRAFNWGASLNRERYNLRAKWNHRSRRRNALVAAGASIEPGTYNWTPAWHTLDVSAEYHFLKRFAVFANLTNVNNATPDVEISGPSTPLHARFRQRLDFASLWTLGVKATF